MTEQVTPRKNGGYQLAVYYWEAQTYADFDKVKLDRDEAAKILKKLVRHFKTSKVYISVINVKRSEAAGSYFPNNGYPYISIGKTTRLATIVHEYAHHLDAVRHPETKQWHGKSFKRELKRVYTFAKRYLPETLDNTTVVVPSVTNTRQQEPTGV